MRKKKTHNGVDISSTLGMKVTPRHTAWVVVAHRAGAQFFQKDGDEFTKIHEIPFPEGRGKERDLVSDRPGRAFDSYTKASGGHLTGAPRHAMTSRETPSEHATLAFSEIIAEWLETARKENKFNELMLVAEPRFMGRLEGKLSSSALRVLVDKKEKDYSWLDERDIEKRLKELFPKHVPLA